MPAACRITTALRTALAGLVLSCCSSSLLAQDAADDWRGGWISDEGGYRTVLILVVRGERVTGTWCARDCADPANLDFIDDGALFDGLISADLWTGDSEDPGINEIQASLQDGQLVVEIIEGPSAGNIINFERSPRDTRAAAPSGGFGGPAPVYEPPGPAELLSPDKVTGLWLSGVGPGKQYFIFSKHRGGLRGLACGPCTDASGMAPLENISISGTNIHFDIVHENSGPGILEYGPHANISDATVSHNELHFTTRPSFADENYALIHMTLLGPVKYSP